MSKASTATFHASRQLQRRRRWYNRLFGLMIGLSGISVVLMLAALFVYLISEVVPLFKNVDITPLPPVAVLPQNKTAKPDVGLVRAGWLATPAFYTESDSGHYQLLATAASEACLYTPTQAVGCLQQWSLSAETDTLTSVSWMSAGQALLAGYQSGRLQQWMLLPNHEGQVRLQLAKELSGGDSAIVKIASENNRRGFATLAADGQLAIHYSALTRPLARFNTGITDADALVFGNDNQLLSVYQRDRLHQFNVRNPHPEISWQTLWHSVWYEGFSRPDFVWQPSSGSDDYQPKFSLVPLTVGTLKAALYAMLFAAPLAIMAAIYTACFLPSAARRRITGCIELMAAFPTVILGFIAAVWLAPVIEGHLLALLLWLLFLPLSILALAALWPYLPAAWQRRVTDGREIVLLMVWLLAISGLIFVLANQLDGALFDGGIRSYLDQQGIYYEQRNALIIGIAMGFAVVPGIFAIADDVLYRVPAQLTRGALALGATPWQTVLRISLPLAAPGLIAAMLVGFGRAIGETMILLMATGNSPVTNFNLFEGLRSLTATLAIELPEATVGSSHFRVLFVAALLLLLFTFVANTAAEVIRQRLRKKYQRL